MKLSIKKGDRHFTVSRKRLLDALRAGPSVWKEQELSGFILAYEVSGRPRLARQQLWNGDTLDGRRGAKNPTWHCLVPREIKYVYVETMCTRLNKVSKVSFVTHDDKVYDAHVIEHRESPMPIPKGFVFQKLQGSTVMYLVGGEPYPAVEGGLIMERFIFPPVWDAS